MKAEQVECLTEGLLNIIRLAGATPVNPGNDPPVEQVTVALEAAGLTFDAVFKAIAGRALMMAAEVAQQALVKANQCGT